MSRYEVAHDLDRTWICKDQNNNFFWGPRASVYRFRNYKEAKNALDSLTEEFRMYNESYKRKVHFMKAYDSKEHWEQEMRYREANRFYLST